MVRGRGYPLGGGAVPAPGGSTAENPALGAARAGPGAGGVWFRSAGPVGALLSFPSFFLIYISACN